MATRRRGDALETALLDAAWAQLAEHGYSGFTFEAIAQRAGTSKPVLYRRWSTREELLVAAMQHYRGLHRRVPEPTGSLRGDVLALLREANKTSGAMIAVISARLGTYFDETGATPAELRKSMLGEQVLTVEELVQRAVDRGELDGPLPPRVAAVPFDLFRHEAMMTLSSVPDATLVSIVDEVFLPLVEHHRRT